jgi:RluA family pseudouridine synthase
MLGNLEFKIVFEDQEIVVVNKPSGLLVIPDGYNPNLPCLASLLEERYGHIWVVHRIDKDTSGIVVFARTAEAHRRLNFLFREREIKKTYHALVSGTPTWVELDVRIPLRVNGDRRHRTIVDYELGKPAITDFQVIKIFDQFSYIKAEPHTGYTHQLRAHLYSIGHPILFDPLYSRYNTPSVVIGDPTALALHAYQIQFQHPITNQPLIFCAVDPPYFKESMKE